MLPAIAHKKRNQKAYMYAGVPSNVKKGVTSHRSALHNTLRRQNF